MNRLASIVQSPSTPITEKLGPYATTPNGFQEIAVQHSFRKANPNIRGITMSMNPSATYVGNPIAAAITRRKGAVAGPKTIGKQNATATVSRVTGGKR